MSYIPARQGDEPTNEMINAGLKVYCEHCPDSADGGEMDAKMIAEVYLAMRLLSTRTSLAA
jgi:hypothetical protein